jgi:hypothetical protein
MEKKWILLLLQKTDYRIRLLKKINRILFGDSWYNYFNYLRKESL